MKTQHEQRIEAVRQFKEVELWGVIKRTLVVFLLTFALLVAYLLISLFDKNEPSNVMSIIIITLSFICIAYVFIGGITYMLNERKILRECKRLGITYRDWRTLKKNIK